MELTLPDFTGEQNQRLGLMYRFFVGPQAPRFPVGRLRASGWSEPAQTRPAQRT